MSNRPKYLNVGTVSSIEPLMVVVGGLFILFRLREISINLAFGRVEKCGYDLLSPVLYWHLIAGMNSLNLRKRWNIIWIQNDTSARREWTIGYIINVDEKQERTQN